MYIIVFVKIIVRREGEGEFLIKKKINKKNK
jgi:hypothetical protein